MLRLATLFLMAMSAANLATAQTPVHVSIYYETLCPDSVKFITKQFYPTWEKMKKYIEVEFIPYGNSNTTNDGFVCQHGPEECKGNKLQACALSHLMDADQKVKFVKCVMSSTNASNSGVECATDINVNYSKIEMCVNGSEGYEDLKRMGEKTKSLTPPLKSVPSVVINNKYVQEEQEKITTNFMDALCSHITGTKPSECAGHSGADHLFLAPIAVVSVFAAILAR